MNARISLLCVTLFALVALQANAQPAELVSATTPPAERPLGHASYDFPGGIVYCHNDQAVYWDLKSGKELELTSDLDGAVVKPPFAASLNGEWLAWRQGSKFWVRQLTEGKPKAIKYTNEDKKWHSDAVAKKRANLSPGEEHFVWENDAVSRMSLSPDGGRFSFEAYCQKPGWVLKKPSPNPVAFAQMCEAARSRNPSGGRINLGPGSPNSIQGLMNNGAALPTYAFVDDTYMGTFLLSAIYNENHISKRHDIYTPAFGDTAESPDAPVYAATPQDIVRSGGSHGGRVLPIGLNGGWSPTPPGSVSPFVKKSACCLAFSGEIWKNGIRLVYFINQAEGRWGPIHIRRVDNDVNTLYDNSKISWKPNSNFPTKTTAWEIPVSLPSCEGLAVRPDGSLAVWSAGNVYLVDYSEMKKGIDAEYRIGFGVFQVKSTTLAQGIFGTCMNWVSNDAFLFSDKKGQLCLWRQGNVEKLYKDVEGYFCYCSVSPTDAHAARVKLEADHAAEVAEWERTHPAAPEKHLPKYNPGELKVAAAEAVALTSQSGSDKYQLFKIREQTRFSIGRMPGFKWEYAKKIGDTGAATLSSPVIKSITGLMQAKHLPGKHIEDIDDPTLCFAGIAPPVDSGQKLAGGAPRPVNNHGTCYLGGSLIVRYNKLKDRYFAVELVSIDPDTETVVYKKRFWPDNGPESTRVASTTK